MNQIDLIIDALEDRVKDYCTDSYELDYYSCCNADLEAGHTADCTLVKALETARELCRLHEVNQELLEVLQNLCEAADNGHVASYSNLWDDAKAAIAKAEGESNE
jgi:hypothetical protein